MIKFLILVCCMVGFGFACLAGDPDRLTGLQYADEGCVTLGTVANTRPEIAFEVYEPEEANDPDSLFERAVELDEAALTRWFKLGIGLDGCYSEAHSFKTYKLLEQVGEIHFLYVLSEQQPTVIDSVDTYLSFETDPAETGKWGRDQREKYAALFAFVEKHRICSEIGKILVGNSNADDFLVRALVYPVVGSDSLFVAICDSCVQWWGGARILEYTNGKIVRQDYLCEGIVEQSIYRVRAKKNPNGDGQLIEVFGMTHMGNGYYHLFKLAGFRLSLVLEAWAVDVHTSDSKTIRKEVLKPEFKDVDGDGYKDVVLSGVIDYWISYDDKVSPFSVSYRYRAVYIWSEKSQRFATIY